MFLKSLEIRGFKSFADKTDFKFRKGVTAVVGPNGSGKSNVSDAVRWVLGEQSVKILRGGKMEDVIFAGTQFRKPVGLAQVSLTLDNSDGSLATEYNEVTVCRRIFRSGESEYLINNVKCRLKDISELFMDTGIGKEGYSLIGQGKIEAILSGKPEERRNLIEEAAGIVKFKSRKEEAEKRLNNTDENLVRINDIISTYEERMEPLKLEKEKALKFNTLSEELNKKEVSLIVHTINNMQEELKNINEELNIKLQELKEKKEYAAEIKQELRICEQKIENIDKKTLEKKEEYYNIKESINTESKDIEVCNEKINSLKENIERNKKEIEDIKIKINSIKNKKILLKNELEIKFSEREAKKKEIELISGNVEKEKKLMLQKEEELKRLQKEQMDNIKRNSSINNEISLIEQDIRAKNEMIKNLKSAIMSSEHNIIINSETCNALKEFIKLKNDEIKYLNDEIGKSKKSVSINSITLNKKENEFREINMTLTKNEANKKMLEDLEKHYEGYNRTVKNLMESIRNNKISNVEDTKVLGSVFKVEKKYEIAIEIALGASISNVITKNEDVAKNLINYLKNNHLGRATFLPINIIKGKKLNLNNLIKSSEGFIGIASDIINYEEKYSGIMNYVLGRTVICKDMSSALAIAKNSNYSIKIVTLDGEIVSPGGALTGGSIRNKNVNVLGRKREINELEKAIKIRKELFDKLSKEIQDLKMNIKDLDEHILNKKDDMHGIKIDLTQKEQENRTLEAEILKLKNEIEDKKNTLQKIIADKTRLENDIQDRKNMINSVESEDVLSKDEMLDLEKFIKYKNTEINTLNSQLMELRIESAKLDEVIIGKKNDSERFVRDIDELLNKSEILKESSIKNDQNIVNLHKEIDFKKISVEEKNKKTIELEIYFKDEEIKKEKLKAEFKSKDNYIITILDDISNRELQINKIEIAKARKESQNENIYTKLNSEFELTYAEALDISEIVEDELILRGEITNTKNKISKLGVVNLGAISEYEDIKEKYEFMFSQVEDLEKAKEELILVIKDMTVEMKSLFKQNFAILNYNFDRTFKDLFKGGSAELILGEGDELTASIDINVEPPGKKLQNINLMSGGEKVLSAIALLFAILEMKPTPFCILDEIEAALDDANVYRYAEFLNRYSEKTQFIVITHRKGTMECSDIIYGITMEEKGISKVVSVDLSEEFN